MDMLILCWDKIVLGSSKLISMCQMNYKKRKEKKKPYGLHAIFMAFMLDE